MGEYPIKRMLDEEGVGFYPASITDAIGHKQTKAELTKFLSTYDISVLWPKENDAPYDLAEAIEVLDENLLPTQKYPGVKIQFVNSDNRLEEWQFFGNNYAFTNELGWGQVDSSVLAELQATVFPLTVNLTLSKVLLQTKISYDVDISWSVYRKGIDISASAMKYLNAELVTTMERTDTIKEDIATEKVYSFSGTYKGLTKMITKTISIVDPSFSGTLESGVTINEESIKAAINSENIKQTSSLLGSKSYTWSGINLVDQRTVFVYPATFGNLSSIKDGNNFEYIDSYTKTDMTISGVPYYAYTLTNPASITGFKQIFS